MSQLLSPIAFERVLATSLSLAPEGLLQISPQFDSVFDLSSLDGDNGFRIDGAHSGDHSGYSIASAGDVNGDGFADIIVGAKSVHSYAGAAYVVFGHQGGFDASMNLAKLDGTDGFQLAGKAGSFAGDSVSSAGDVNGDGYDDVIVGARGADAHGPITGASYVVFGGAGGFDPTIKLSALDGTDGFQINGEASYDFSGNAVSSAGDVNGDGFADLLIGSSGNDPSGAGYVVFGKASGFSATLELSSLNGHNGFKINGAPTGVGFGLASAGDFNGDGYDDLIFGAPGAQSHGLTTGGAYIVFGKKAGFAPTLDLSTLNGANGFEVLGVANFDRTGRTVAAAGDVNGDGFGDVIMGADSADPNDSSDGGSAYVVFGKASGFDAQFDLTDLDGENGFRINGGNNDYAGTSVASAGDVNGDGFADLIVGVPGDHAAYVVFGKATGFSATLALASLDVADGFEIAGALGDRVGWMVSSAGDVNGDGLADLIVGDDHANSYAGASYVVFGKLPTTAVHLTGTEASQSLVGGELKDVLSGLGGDDMLWGHGGKDKLTGGTGNDTLVGGAGKDVLIGSAGADVFQYRDLADSTAKAHDTIKGIGKTDVIDLHLLDADTGTAGDQAFHLVSSFSGHAGELVVSYDGKQTLAQGDVDGDGTADLVIAISGDHHDFANFVL